MMLTIYLISVFIVLLRVVKEQVQYKYGFLYNLPTITLGFIPVVNTAGAVCVILDYIYEENK